MQRNLSFPAVIAVMLLLAVALGACSGSPAPAPATIAPTKTPKPTFTPSPAPTLIPIVTPTLEPTAVPASPTVAPTAAPPTATPAPQFSAAQTVNVRMGPGTAYPVIGQVNAGQSYKVMGRNADSTWLQFNYNGDPAWVIANLVSFAGDANAVQIAQNIPAPPTPRPVPTAAPQPMPQAQPQPAQPAPAPAPNTDFSYVQGSARGAPQCGVPHFSGQVRYQNGSGQNGVCVLLDYFGPRTIKFSGGGGQGDGNWGFSPCGDGACKGPIKISIIPCPGTIPDNGLNIEPGYPVPAPVSDIFTATINDKCVEGQWENIIFKNNRQ